MYGLSGSVSVILDDLGYVYLMLGSFFRVLVLGLFRLVVDVVMGVGFVVVVVGLVLFGVLVLVLGGGLGLLVVSVLVGFLGGMTVDEDLLIAESCIYLLSPVFPRLLLLLLLLFVLAL